MTQPTPEQLRMARECAVSAVSAKLPGLMGNDFKGNSPKLRARIAKMRCAEGDHFVEVQSALLAIQATEARIAALEWRPISTWPGTDEAYALVCNAGSVYPIIAGYDSNDEEWFSFNGYYEKFGKGPLVPDYWMPLPIPPATEALGKGSE